MSEITKLSLIPSLFGVKELGTLIGHETPISTVATSSHDWNEKEYSP